MKSFGVRLAFLSTALGSCCRPCVALGAPDPLSPQPASSSQLTSSTPNRPTVDQQQWAPTPLQISLTAGVPFFDESILHGDLSVDLRIGYKLWWLVPYVAGGFRQTRMDPALVPDIAKKKKIVAWHVTAGVRLEIPASRRFIPFIGLGGELAAWGFTSTSTEFCEDSYYPNAWRCYDEALDWKRGWAIKPHIGFLFKPEPGYAVEFWLERGTVWAPDFFTRRVTFYNPSFGMAAHF
jgi:hypothetical protein